MARVEQMMKDPETVSKAAKMMQDQNFDKNLGGYVDTLLKTSPDDISKSISKDLWVFAFELVAWNYSIFNVTRQATIITSN